MADVLPEFCSCSALRQAARHVTRFYDDALRPVGLGLNQYSILAKLHRGGPQTLRELAKLLVMDRSTVGHLVRPLAVRGLVDVEVSQEDRRSRVVRLTDHGDAVMRRARPMWADAERAFRKRFGHAAANGLHQLLEQVTTTPLDGRRTRTRTAGTSP